MIPAKRLPTSPHAALGILASSLILVAVITAACGSSSAANDDDDGDGVIIETISASPTTPPADVGTPTSATPGVTAVVPTATPSAPVLTGFIWPIAGGCLPQSDNLMPNAPREYRNGIHEGVDFYDVDNCTPIAPGMDVLAAKGGRIIRADTDFVEMTPVELQMYLANPNTEEALDRFRGRQVWIDHGGGVVSRYCHLDGVASGISVGSNVTAGQVIAFVGESGTPETIVNPGHEYHLHFELRVGNTYLGAGLAPADMRALYEGLFAP